MVFISLYSLSLNILGSESTVNAKSSLFFVCDTFRSSLDYPTASIRELASLAHFKEKV